MHIFLRMLAEFSRNSVQNYIFVGHNFVLMFAFNAYYILVYYIILLLPTDLIVCLQFDVATILTGVIPIPCIPDKEIRGFCSG